MELVEWTTHFIKFKDAMRRRIKDIKVEENVITIQEKGDITKKYIIDEKLEKKEADYIVCTNTKKNVDILIHSWKEFASDPKLTIIFANPETNENWLITPAIHEKISDEESLHTGIQSMFESITPL